MAIAFAVVLSSGGAAALAQGATDVAESRARWHAARVVDYEFGYQKFCECHRDDPAETIVTVADGRIAAVRYRYPAPRADFAVEQRNLQWYWTIEDLFSLIETAAARGAVVRVSYDDQLGYPLRLYIDYDPQMVGDEVDVRVGRLQQAL